ncbi:DUF1385 domain-containing protein [Paenactinomyces guangxiensis]|uniref:DUF1385 domain-containing protein n=1 Tax=Paenactinomyces guangxiensis TaxID=1490290 RepID=A0A7W2A985_9BACL|nr:DUF1385 domain-containing protein [Paenactinomyces guangxiensis]MBA4494959.1 DUF1385 domain-containing protein [Paenactinomyces guangxiensis]MBH8592042.1 DUF1385 domain-containing protein [Paenactinomyces guangxiensis]
MFGGRYTQVTAIRRKDGQIETYEVIKKSPSSLSFFKKIPFIRGIISLIEASASGAKHLQFASEKYDLDTEEDGEDIQDGSVPSATDPQEGTKDSKLVMILGVALVGVLSLLVGKVIFTALPAFLASVLFDRFIQNLIVQNLIEGAIKTALLLAYLWIISQTPMIKRVFQYHGAEHKVISTYEQGEELTVKNVQKQSTLHYRCGSSFIILSIIVGVILYSFFTYDNVWDRILIRLLLIPVVIGVSYELLRITNAVRDIPVLTYLGYPGLWLQKLTTKEPMDDQVEVAIAAFTRMRELDAEVAAEIDPRHTRLVHSSLTS